LLREGIAAVKGGRVGVMPQMEGGGAKFERCIPERQPTLSG